MRWWLLGHAGCRRRRVASGPRQASSRGPCSSPSSASYCPPAAGASPSSRYGSTAWQAELLNGVPSCSSVKQTCVTAHGNTVGPVPSPRHPPHVVFYHSLTFPALCVLYLRSCWVGAWVRRCVVCWAWVSAWHWCRRPSSCTGTCRRSSPVHTCGYVHQSTPPCFEGCELVVTTRHALPARGAGEMLNPLSGELGETHGSCHVFPCF